MPETNMRQAMVPEGAQPLDNPRGTAPGLWMEMNGRITLCCFPGRQLNIEGDVRERSAPAA